jgi:hypothetical protein
MAGFSNRLVTVPGMWEWRGKVARCRGLRKEGHNTGRDGNEGRNGRQLVHWGRCFYVGELGYRQDKERCGRSAGVVLVS